jgi:endonuclease YncB( thermonuclease family)
VTAAMIAAPAGAETIWHCREVIDGDTIVAQSDAGQVVRIDLFGIDAPELDQPFGAEAKQFVEETALGRVITLSETGADAVVVTSSVQVDGGDLSEALVREGLAWISQEGETSEVIAITLFNARSQSAGLWSDPEAEHPSLWRKRHQRQPTPTPTQRLSDVAATIDLAGKDGQPVVIADIPPRFTRHRETKLLVDKMAVIAAVAEGLAKMEAAYERHCSIGRGPSSSAGGSVWSEELGEWVDGTESTREEACRTLGGDIPRVRRAIKQARDQATDEARRFGVNAQTVREVVDYFDLTAF